ncbi:MAG: ADP-glyceromanno-heptose 6-epimerase [Bacteroidales bacterium]|jgi:ADP-L-glycero-D-manno-heptose 6-epimerase|nr:ADP-glyceromanno-heptose 6-epimerase [Bacteroidales bacterium]
MIIITGAAGFIGSVLTGRLNEDKIFNLALVDDFSRNDKARNLENKSYRCKVHRNEFFSWLKDHQIDIDFIFHIGARTDTIEFNQVVFDELNLNYSKKLFSFCTNAGIPLIYASSAATYGLGEYGYSDDHSVIRDLKPLNPYGKSKNDFDIWVLEQKDTPPFWAGMKFFNVYGPNEYHKGRMASVIFHAYNQMISQGHVKLFRSHNPDYADGGQLRDFIYVKDVVDVLVFLMQTKPDSGIYNLGTGMARSFYDLAKATFNAANIPEKIEFIDTPVDIRDKYQYFTQAEMNKLAQTGYTKSFYKLEDGIQDYVSNYLMKNTVL